MDTTATAVARLIGVLMFEADRPSVRSCPMPRRKFLAVFVFAFFVPFALVVLRLAAALTPVAAFCASPAAVFGFVALALALRLLLPARRAQIIEAALFAGRGNEGCDKVKCLEAVVTDSQSQAILHVTPAMRHQIVPLFPDLVLVRKNKNSKRVY